MKCSAFMVLLCLWPSLLIAQPTIVIDAEGNHYYSDGPGTMVLVENVLRLPGAPTPTPPQPPDEQDPPTNSRVEQVRVFSRDVGDAGNAPIIAAVVGALADQEFTFKTDEARAFAGNRTPGQVAWEVAMSTTIEAIGPPKAAKWSQWEVNVTPLAASVFDADYFFDVESGVRNAYGLDASDITAILEAVQNGDDPESVVVAGAIDVTKIIELIMIILNFLRSIGIL